MATSTEAVQIAGSSISGVLGHFKRKNVDMRVGSFIAGGGLIGTTAGVFLTAWLTRVGLADFVIEITYVIFLGFIGTAMFIESINAKWGHKWGWHSQERGDPIIIPLHRLPWRVKFPRSKLYMSGFLPIGLGFFVGVLTALLGVGRRVHHGARHDLYFGDADVDCHRHLLFTVIILTASVALQQSLVNVSVDLILALCLMVGGVLGAQVGVRLATRLPAQDLRIWLALIVLGVCGKLAFDLLIYPPLSRRLRCPYEGMVMDPVRTARLGQAAAAAQRSVD